MNTLKILHAADLHLDSRFESLKPENANRRREMARNILPRLAETAVSGGAQALIVSGDVFESDSVTPETVHELCRSFGALDIPVIISTGNHDPYFPGCIWDRISLPENVHLFNSEQISPLTISGLNARFWGAGFTAPFCPPLLKGFSVGEKLEGIFDVLVLHGDLSAGSDYCPITRQELEASGADYAALGHIHQRSELAVSGKTAFAYPGCTEGRGFDELGKKGCYFVTISEDGVTAEFVSLSAVSYVVLKIDVGGKNLLKALRTATIDCSDNCYMRIILCGEIDAPIDLIALRREFEGSFAEFQIYDETTIATDLWADMEGDDISALFRRKFRALYDSAESESEREKIKLAVRFGLEALKGEGGQKL